MELTNTFKCPFLFNEDEKLIIELHDSSIYEGDYADSTDTRIDIFNVLVYPKTGSFTTIKDIVSLYRHEITSIRRFKTRKSNHRLGNEVIKTIPFLYDEFHNLLRYSMRYVYLNQIDSRYVKSISCLRSKETIGIVGLGMETKGKVPINYIVISTADQIFIYDMFALDKGRFPCELRQLFEQETVQKVIHNSCILIDYLRKCYEIEMRNIFDTAVADLLLQHRTTGVAQEKWRTLSECLSDYFRFPFSLVEDDSLNLDWEEQPLNEFCKRRAALLVGYLIMLRDLLERNMLGSFYKEVERYSNSLLE